MFTLSFKYSGGGGFDPACREMSELMIEQPDGTLCPCTSANMAALPGDTSPTLDNRTRAALEGSVMDGLFSAFDTQAPLSGFTQVASAGNVMSDGAAATDNRVFIESEGTKTFLDKGYGTTIRLRKPDTPHKSIALAMADAANQIREIARNYYTNYDELSAGDVTLSEVGVEVFKLGPEKHTFDKAIIGEITITYEDAYIKEHGRTSFPSPEPRGLIARLHFHWTGIDPSLTDKNTFKIVSHNVGPNYEAWIASYTEERRALP